MYSLPQLLKFLPSSQILVTPQLLELNPPSRRAADDGSCVTPPYSDASSHASCGDNCKSTTITADDMNSWFVLTRNYSSSISGSLKTQISEQRTDFLNVIDRVKVHCSQAVLVGGWGGGN